MRKKDEIFIGLILLLIISFGLVSSFEFINATNVSLKENYSRGDMLSADFHLKIENISPESQITTNLGHWIGIRDFLSENSKGLDCEVYDCQDRYVNVSPPINSVVLPDSNKSFGIKVGGDGDLYLNKVIFNISTSFGESNTIPLRISFFEGSLNWYYMEPTNNFNRFRSYGCFIEGGASGNQLLEMGGMICEKISNINYTQRVRLGLNYTLGSGSDNPRVVMSLYGEGYQNQIAQCNFTTDSGNSCVANTSEEILTGEYVVCAEKVSGEKEILVKIQESNEAKCGYNSLSTGGSSVKDYALFVDLPTYKGLSGTSQIIVNDSLRNSKSYLSEVYSMNCSRVCFLPFRFYKNSQDLEINSIKTYVSHDGDTNVGQEIYEISKEETRGNFEGEVNLEKASFLADFEGNETLEVFLESPSGTKRELFRGEVMMREEFLEIGRLYPLEIAAGVPVIFELEVLSGSEINSYYWDFGDGEIRTTDQNIAVKTYWNISEYNLSVRVTNKNNESKEKNFTIETISPRDYLESNIDIKRDRLDKIASKIDLLNVPFLNKIKEKLGLEGLRSNLTKIKNELNLSTTDQQFLELARELNEIRVPRDVWIDKISYDIFITKPEDIDLEIVGEIAGETISDPKYKNFISSWEMTYVNGTKEKISIVFLDESGIKKNLAEVYKIEVTPEDERSFLVIEESSGMESSVVLENKGNGMVLELSPNQRRSLNLISFDFGDRDIYVVLEPSKIDLSNDITVCNLNKICEKSIGENYKNCRDDCKPWSSIITLLIIVIVIGIVVYTFIQIQFKKKYELYLFKSEQELQNLVESIRNSREHNVSYKEVTDKLIKRGWSKEQVEYAIKKSRGEKTRPYELIPIEKIMNSIKGTKKK